MVRDTTTGSYKYVSCSRFEELIESMKFHAELARTANVLTEFRLLNGHPPLVIGDPANSAQSEENYSKLVNKVFKMSPEGGTPLCRHINEVARSIRTISVTLRAHRHRAVVILATDGESSDGDISEALKPLRDLPVWVVVRLCTDNDLVVKYWGRVDENLELDMEVLDDYESEAERIHGLNGWLTYGLPLHRLREFGCTVRELDLLNERSLTPDEINRVCALILGGDRSKYANVDGDSASALIMDQPLPEALTNDAGINMQTIVFCPVTLCMRPWVHTVDPPSASKKRQKSSFRVEQVLIIFIFVFLVLHAVSHFSTN